MSTLAKLHTNCYNVLKIIVLLMFAISLKCLGKSFGSTEQRDIEGNGFEYK